MYVKYSTKNGVRYGDIDSWSKEGKKAKDRGQALIEDGITGERFYLDVNKLVYVGMPEYEAYLNEQSNIAMEKSNAIKGLGVGKLMRFTVADGVVYYEVTKVNKASVNLEWRGYYNLDRYVDQVLGYSGKMPIARAEALVGSWDALRSIIGED